MVMREQQLKSMINQERVLKGDVYVAEGTALVYPVFNKPVNGLKDNTMLLNLKRTMHCDISNFIGVHDSVDDGLPIYHTVVEIMINLEYTREEYKSSIYITCTKPNGEEKYPVTLQGFCNGCELSGERIYLRPLMQITNEDRELYDEIMKFEPPLLELNDEVSFTGTVPVGVHIGNLGFILKDQIKQEEGDIIISMGCVDLVIPSSVGS
jgi:hypothetical protein